MQMIDPWCPSTIAASPFQSVRQKSQEITTPLSSLRCIRRSHSNVVKFIYFWYFSNLGILEICVDEKAFHTSLVTPEQVVLETDAIFAVVPASDGLQGILPNHAPLISKMKIGILKMETHTEVHQFMVNGGYMQMKDNALTIL